MDDKGSSAAYTQSDPWGTNLKAKELPDNFSGSVGESLKSMPIGTVAKMKGNGTVSSYEPTNGGGQKA